MTDDAPGPSSAPKPDPSDADDHKVVRLVRPRLNPPPVPADDDDDDPGPRAA